MFLSEFCEISKNTFSYRTPPAVAVSLYGGNIKLKAGYTAEEKESMVLLCEKELLHYQQSQW